MDHSTPVVWAKFVVKSAIDYFRERKVRCGLLVDNTTMKDGVLSSISPERTDFIICVSPDFVTRMEYNPTHLDVVLNFNGMHHQMSIPYSSIIMVVAIDEKRVLDDEGHLNTISIPPAILPTNAAFLRKNTNTVVETNEIIQEQPFQEELANDVNISMFNRRRGDLRS